MVMTPVLDVLGFKVPMGVIQEDFGGGGMGVLTHLY